jgi:membrane fusion protein (multidrug efflux system)
LLLAAVLVAVAVGGRFLVPWAVTALNTISTDDAYVNGHVTFVAPRVAGQVSRVLVDDNYRVKRGDVLVQLDREPFEVQVAIKKAAVTTAEADLAAANAEVRAQVAQARANRFKLEHTIEDVSTQIANLGAAVATLSSKKATLELSKSNLKRGEELAPGGGISKEELDQRRQTVKVNAAAVDQALQEVYAIRVGLGLPAEPPKDHDLSYVPEDHDQNFSSVRQALATLIQSAAEFGYYQPRWDATPKQVIAEFYKQDPDRNLDRIYAQLIPRAPAIKQAEAKLLQARSDLAQAELNLRYCDVVSEIDGVVTRRGVNPGNNVQVGQSLMAVRSLTEIWIDANFKETQLADLRIGQQVRCEVDMYGSRREYKGHITGFTMGTGETLALLPPQNATGNFVKIVQRLPVRIELENYDPDKEPLFVGLSVTPYVYYKKRPEGPNAGAVLQPNTPLPQAPPEPRP